jgi:hypothetical protein
VVKVHAQDTGELVYALRIHGRSFDPKVFRAGRYRVSVVSGGDERVFGNLTPADDRAAEELRIRFE